MAEKFNMRCPFTGEEKSYREIEVDGRWKGESKNGSYIVAGDKEGLDRERGVVEFVNGRIRELVSTHGSAEKASSAYYAQVKQYRDEERVVAGQIADVEGQYRMAEAARLVSQGLGSAPTTRETELETEMNELRTRASDLKAKLDEDHPHYGRILSELGGAAKKERGEL